VTRRLHELELLLLAAVFLFTVGYAILRLRPRHGPPIDPGPDCTKGERRDGEHG
jgi:hypothetical protein